MQEFRDAIERRDMDALVSLMTEDVVFRSPVVHTPYRGRDQVKLLLGTVAQVFEDFRYTRSDGEPRVRPFWHTLVHVVNHGTQHRSELARFLTDRGHSPGELDLLDAFRLPEVS